MIRNSDKSISNVSQERKEIHSSSIEVTIEFSGVHNFQKSSKFITYSN